MAMIAAWIGSGREAQRFSSLRSLVSLGRVATADFTADRAFSAANSLFSS